MNPKGVAVDEYRNLHSQGSPVLFMIEGGIWLTIEGGCNSGDYWLYA